MVLGVSRNTRLKQIVNVGWIRVFIKIIFQTNIRLRGPVIHGSNTRNYMLTFKVVCISIKSCPI